VANISPDPTNILFQLAVELVNHSSKNLFLTGKAGTGKTTFLKHIRKNCQKEMAVVAPTGVAAINAGGVTIHSFFQLPLSPFVPDANKFREQNEEAVGPHALLSRLRVTSEKAKVLRQLELLIIDEISMVRCDTMDAIDTVLRHVRKRPHERFGGVQLLLIGDMFQLSPVVKEQEWSLLSTYYASPYFFESHAIREAPPVYIEFEKIYRQKDEVFISLLNQVRTNRLDEEGQAILETRYQPGFQRQPGDGYIVLTTHNERAREINKKELEAITGKQHIFQAEVKNEFSPNAYPADEALALKEGAQVMFIRNDSDRERRFFNGKIGTVQKLSPEKIIVKCGAEEDEIEVGPETWENIRYTLNPAKRGVEEEVLGTFTQFPLRLAWAITIHKSQGLTFEKAIIDAGYAFAPGQVYVALSRCTQLEGIVLQSRIRPGSLLTDPRIVQFSASFNTAGSLQDEFRKARSNYLLQLLVNTFDFRIPLDMLTQLGDYLKEHKSSFNDDTWPWLDLVKQRLEGMQAVALKFQNWFRAQFQLGEPAENTLLAVKTADGANHFSREIESVIDLLRQSPVSTDSQMHAKEFNDSIRELFAWLSQIGFMLRQPQELLDAEKWHRRKKDFNLPGFSIQAYAGAEGKTISSEHPQLLKQLRKVRDAICSQKDLPIYMVASTKTLQEMVSFLPQTTEELEKITGFGKIRVEAYGEQFLNPIKAFAGERGLASRIHEKGSKKKTREKKQTESSGGTTRIDTKLESFRLFRQGLTVEQIAQKRNLTRQTIEGHLSHYVEIGEIDIEQLVLADTIAIIEKELVNFNGTLSELRARLGDKVGYGDIRLVMAWNKYKTNLSSRP
jgi:hypothetical protein